MSRRTSAPAYAGVSAAVIWLGALLAAIEPPASAENPLEPVDTSSPRATLESFLSLTGETARRYAAFRENPSRSTQARLRLLLDDVERLFDLSAVAPAAQRRLAAETFFLLWDVTAKIELPDAADIPDAAAVARAEHTSEPLLRWRIPDTGITIARVGEGSRTGEFLFSPDTVARAPRYYEAARDLPYLRAMPLSNVYRIDQTLTGWMIPPAWVDALPEWANTLVAGQVLWKWLAVLLILGLVVAATIAAYRWAQRRKLDYRFFALMRHLSAPLVFFILAETQWVLTSRQINVTGAAAPLPDIMREVALGVAIVWCIWIAASWTAERMLRSPQIPRKSLRANLTNLAARSVGSLAALIVIFRVAQDLGVPVYGLVAGAGVGGLAIALAARSTLENVIGTLNIYADGPVRVGDFCRYGDDAPNGVPRIGTIEEIGLRSTRIRGIDRTITTIPNADFANLHLVNLTRRDRMLMSTTLGLRYETTPEQLRRVLDGFQEMLLGDPRVDSDTAHVRVTGFGPAALEVALFAYVLTPDWNKFLEIQEDLIVRIMKIVNEAGTGLALPSTIVYRARDPGTNHVGEDMHRTRHGLTDRSKVRRSNSDRGG
jgi:MscS family membrane protein